MTDLNEFEAQQRTRDAAYDLTVVKRELAIAKNQLTAARLEAAIDNGNAEAKNE